MSAWAVVAYTATFLTREGPSQISTSARVAQRIPTSNEYRVLPNPRQERSQGHHTTRFREGTRNRLISRVCALVCAEFRTAQRYLFRPSLTPIRTKYSTPSGDAGHNTGASYDLSFPLLPSSPPLCLLSHPNSNPTCPLVYTIHRIHRPMVIHPQVIISGVLFVIAAISGTLYFTPDLTIFQHTASCFLLDIPYLVLALDNIQTLL